MKKQPIHAIVLGSLMLGILLTESTAGEPMQLSGHTDAVYDVAFSPNGRILASGSYDRTVKIWDLATGVVQATLTDHKDQVFRIEFSPDGKSLASCSGDGTVIIWDVAKQKRRKVLTAHGDPMIDVAYSSDGRLLATAGSHIETWKQDAQVWTTPHSPLFFAIAFSPDQKSLACGTNDLIRIHDVQTAEKRFDLNVDNGMVYQVAYSPNGKFLASASSKGRLDVWNVSEGKKDRSVMADETALFATAFSPDGKHLVSAGRERVVRTWTVADLQLVDERRGPEETILAVSYSPDGKRIASGAYDGGIHVWSLE